MTRNHSCLGALLAVVLLPLGWTCPASAAQFQNLDFESVIPPLVPNDPAGYGRVPIANAMPGWSAFVGSSPVNLVATNSFFLDSASISLFGPGGPPVIEGNYTAFLLSAHVLHSDPLVTASVTISQTGQVPNDTLSIRMRALVYGPFEVSLGGQTISMTPVLVAPNYTLYAGDVSALAGQIEELRITAVDRFAPPTYQYTSIWLDSIQFSPEPIPEPSVLMLLLGGGLFVIVWKWARRPSLEKTTRSNL